MEQKSWDKIWGSYKELNWFGKRFKNEEEKSLRKIFESLKLSKDIKIIDIGCGTGYILNFFRKNNYPNSIGIDNSKNALELCKKLFNFTFGKDIFLMDCRKIDFSDNRFDLVFSEGLIEHFKNPLPIVREMCRLSKKWILLIQPNSKSIIGRTKNILSKIVSVSWQKEYEYTKQDYINMFNKFGFILENHGQINFNEVVWLLFRRQKNEDNA